MSTLQRELDRAGCPNCGESIPAGQAEHTCGGRIGQDLKIQGKLTFIVSTAAGLGPVLDTVKAALRSEGWTIGEINEGWRKACRACNPPSGEGGV